MTLCPYCGGYCGYTFESGSQNGCRLGNTKTDRQMLIDYLLMKARQEDWHGVSDAANDLREMDAREKK